MIFRLRKPIVLAAALVALGLYSTSARADLTITVQEDSGAVQTFSVTGVPGLPTNDPSLSEATVTTTDYKITILGGEANQFTSGGGTLSNAEVLSSTVSITNTSGSSGHVLHITVTGTGYTAPTAPPTINTDSQIGGSVTQATSTNTLTFQSYVNGSGFGAQTPPISSKASYSSDMSGSIASLSSPFSVAETIDVKLNSMGDKINYASSTKLSQTIPQSVVPEPSSLAIAGIGALGLIGYGLRRRRAVGA
jgi:hypothetical protein